MRISINVTEKMLAEIDEVAQEMGVSRSALCTVWVGEKLKAHKYAYNLAAQVGEKLGDSVTLEGLIKEIAVKELSEK